MKILMVLTSHDELGSTGKKTGFWLEEFAAPYYVFKDAGVDITLASPKGGQPPLDPKSDEKDSQTAATTRFKADKEAQNALAHTMILRDLCADDYDALFYPGGHGPLWDLAEDRCSIALIDTMYAQGKPVAAVCHAPGVLRHAKAPDGSPLVLGKQVTGFSNSEEAAVGLTDVVPFLVEDELQKKGGNYVKGADWQAFSVHDGNLITGQNPASSEAVAKMVLEQLWLALYEQNIGGDAAGMSAATQAKRHCPKLEIVVFERSPHTSFSAWGVATALHAGFTVDEMINLDLGYVAAVLDKLINWDFALENFNA